MPMAFYSQILPSGPVASSPSVVTSLVELRHLSRTDLGATVGCAADNADGLVERPPHATATVTMLRKL